VSKSCERALCAGRSDVFNTDQDNQISKKEVLQNASCVFEGSGGKHKNNKKSKEQARLFEKIGHIEMKNNWL